MFRLEILPINIIISYRSNTTLVTSEMEAATHYGTDFSVQLGPWINWSYGTVFGATYTVTRANGNLLVAFAAFFVTYVSTRFWRILCLVVHFTYSSHEQADALHHQRQATLRNSYSPAGSVVTLVELLWAWRSKAARPYWRILPLLLLAAFCAAGFTM